MDKPAARVAEPPERGQRDHRGPRDETGGGPGVKTGEPESQARKRRRRRRGRGGRGRGGEPGDRGAPPVAAGATERAAEIADKEPTSVEPEDLFDEGDPETLDREDRDAFVSLEQDDEPVVDRADRPERTERTDRRPAADDEQAGRRRRRRGGRRRRRAGEDRPARDEGPRPAERGSRGVEAIPNASDAAMDEGEVIQPDEEPLEEGEELSLDTTAPTVPAVPFEDLPSVKKEMVINVVPREECRIAILQQGKLEEIYLERASSENYVGNIYKGRVTNVEPSIQAAFVDFGMVKNGFLHISDVHPEYFPNGGSDSERVGRKTPRRERPPIQRCLRRGQEIIVQIIKEGIGTKGPTLTTYLSIPGRFLVMLPGMERTGVSRKIEDPEVREKLRTQLADLDLAKDIGFIARTAAIDRTKRELQSDLNYLTRLWRAVESRLKTERAPAELYRESDLVIRTIRDVYTSDIERIIVDDPEVAERARDFLSIFSPRSRDSVVLYDSKTPIFHRYGVEAELERLHSRHVPLKSGGSLVFDSTEALVAIDVNSGRFREHDDAEETAYKINVEAAVEIARQLRLRDLGGVIVCDFIDMRMEKHRRTVERTIAKELKDHKERAKVLRMSRFGIIEMTRQRQRASLTRNVYQDCRHCRGSGLVKTVESVALDVMRLIQLAVTREHIATIEVSVSPEVARLLQNRKRGVLHDLEVQNRRTISILPDSNYGLDQVQMQYFDARGRPVPVN
jgi:ribonuclease E